METKEKEMTATDKLFDQDRPEWYIFESGKMWERNCWKCGKKFTTQLEMNKFCSPQHKNDFLREACHPKL